MLPAILAGASLIGKLFGGASKDRTEGRAAENSAALQRDQLANQQYSIGTNAALQGRNQALDAAGAQNSADVAQTKFNIGNPKERSQQVVLGDILAKLGAGGGRSSVSMPGRVPQYNFGSKLDLLGADTGAAGKQLKTEALLAMLTGSDKSAYPKADFAGALAKGPALPSAPTPTPVSQPGLLDKILNIGSLVGTAAGAIQEYGAGRKKA